jgi:multidrug efflux pump subunit AcrB
LPVDVDDRFSDTSAVILAVTDDTASDRDREQMARRLRDRLRALPDTADANLLGIHEEQIMLEVSPQRLSSLGVSIEQIENTLRRVNLLTSAAGEGTFKKLNLALQPSGSLRNTADIASLPITMPDGSTLHIRDVATVKRSYADPATYLMRANRSPAVGINVTMRKGRNIEALGAAIQRECALMQAQLPASAHIITVNNLPASVHGRIQEFNENLITGVGMIVVVLYLFMGLRSALIVGAMLPITILGTFALMYFTGRDIQQISITALIIALGLVVDNSIVVIDNIERKLSEGLDAEAAAIAGTNEVRIPLLTSNLTTVASFAPLLLLSGGVGEFIRDLGIVTSLATLISLLFNYTVAPLITIKYLQRDHTDTPNRVRRLFLGLVDGLRGVMTALATRAIKRPVLTTALAVVSLLGSVSLIKSLGTQFFLSAVRSQFTIDVTLPQGRNIEETQKVVKRVEEMLYAHPGVVSCAAYIGRGGPTFYYNIVPEQPSSNYAQLVVNTADSAVMHPLVAALQAQFQAIPDARVTALTLEQGPPVGAPVAVRLTGESIASLRAAGERVKAILMQTPGTMSVYQDYGEPPLTLQLAVNQEQAALTGLSSAQVAAVVHTAVEGDNVTTLRDGDMEIPILVRARAEERQSPDRLADLYIPAASGAAVPLRQVANLKYGAEEARIVRRNRERTLTVFAYLDGSRMASQILAETRKKIDAATAEQGGVRASYGGEDEEVGKSFTEMLMILWITIAANLLIVVWEFNSLRTAVAVLSAVPFCMVGAILGLYVMHLPFGFMAFLGITSLAGVVTNHAIVLFEYARAEQALGIPLDQALIKAGSRRLRPILLTVLLSIFGVLPQAFNGGTLWPPLAWSLIFGLLMSLVLTLVIVPSVYRVLGRNSPAA